MLSPESTMKHTRYLLVIAVICTLIACLPAAAWALASNNIPLDSPIYVYIEKLDGFRLINTDIHGIKPYSKAEAARLIIEAEDNLEKMGDDAPELARQMIRTVKALLPREVEYYRHEKDAHGFKVDPLASMRLRYVYLEGQPRSYEREIPDLGGEGIFGI